MNVLRCVNGHFFDGDIQEKCPHCGADPISASNDNKKEKHSLSGLFGKSKSKNSSAGSNNSWEKPVPNPSQNNSNRVSPVAPVQVPFDVDATISLDDYRGTSADPDATVSLDMLNQGNAVDDEATVCLFDFEKVSTASEALQTDVTITVPTTPVKTPFPVHAGSQTAVRHCSGPVVGWLVCVSGNHLGQSFEICAGKNSIGRNPENDIVLSLDGGVSRSKHAIVVYEPKKRDFYLQPGDSSGLTYLNDDFIAEIKKITAYDVIEIGDTKLMLITLCGEAFTWETYIN